MKKKKRRPDPGRHFYLQTITGFEFHLKTFYVLTARSAYGIYETCRAAARRARAAFKWNTIIWKQF